MKLYLTQDLRANAEKTLSASRNGSGPYSEKAALQSIAFSLILLTDILQNMGKTTKVSD